MPRKLESPFKLELSPLLRGNIFQLYWQTTKFSAEVPSSPRSAV